MACNLWLMKKWPMWLDWALCVCSLIALVILVIMMLSDAVDELPPSYDLDIPEYTLPLPEEL